MTRTIALSLLLLALSQLNGCATSTDKVISEQQAIAQVAAPFAQAAVTLDIQADPDLNALHGMANSCTLLIVQAEKSATLNQLLSNPLALKKLFSAAGAQQEILKVDRYSAMPGQSVTLHIDRSENSRYLAIVAGYYPFPQPQHMKLVAVPVETSSQGWWQKTWQAQLAPLSLSLRLGSDSISQFSGATPEPLSPTQAQATPAASTGKGASDVR